MADLLLEKGKPLLQEGGQPLLLEGSQYRLLQPHYIQNAYIDAGTIVTEGIQLPIGWVPTLNVDPLNSNAVTSFYAAGPRGLGWESFNEFGRENLITSTQVSVTSILPVTYWVQSSPGFYKLTGLGVLLSPVYGG